MNKLLMAMIVLSSINIGLNIVIGNVGAICGWLCALIAQTQLLYLGD